ncbi:hypothetical protein FQN60_017543 [Etheostoma spectabile]|uniref:Gypsy retrotransposon integrase-like protein 1 n=1 Tax=Etheostoma spectabile TaxID=54343 RepID=A0A5J5DFI2_9PERO|nr:hypothetical protein FQN60_017543 [Etheostoma spectabile]
MLSVESLQVAEEEVVESSSNKFGDIYTFVAKGCFPQTMNPLRKKNLKRYAQKFIIDEGKLYYVGPKKEEKREVVIEADRKRQIFLDCHFNDIGHHLGQKKTVHRIQSKYYWLGIIKDVVDWVWPFPETQQGNTSVVVLIDYFSKWPEAFPVQKTDALSVARCISKCIYRFGAPKTIVCTQNADFCDEATKLLCDRWTISQKVSPRDQPQLNPLHDCTSPLLKEAIVQMVTDKQAEWDDFLDPVLFLFRTSTNPTTKFSPYSLMFNRKAHLPNEVIANMNAAYKQEKKKNVKRRTHNMPSMTFKIADPLFSAGDSPSPKKLKDTLYLSFPVETVLATEHSSAEDMKTELAYHLAESDVH